ncbi:transposase [Streptomyces barringtoniae]|uniref:transposase n=1 Tax=Streptomyces barringtoniae TaxID=2892029 RepID=UPI001E52F8B7|nr:transposase [Streptomyces barringtoniae]MCC5481095.1 transposase [Streptomyces barringtoniae]
MAGEGGTKDGVAFGHGVQEPWSAAPALALAATYLLSWTKTRLLKGKLAISEPKSLRYRLPHSAARLNHGARRLHLRIAATWPWRHDLAAAFTRLRSLPRPAT